jgi:hypothetical protein
MGHDVAFVDAGLGQLGVAGLDDTSARAVLAVHGGGLSYVSRERILREALGNPLALVELPLALRASQDRGMDVLTFLGMAGAVVAMIISYVKG